MSLREVVRLARSGACSAAELVERALQAIAARDPALAAWELVDAEGARAQARALDARPGADLPLRGACLGVKDIVDVAGLPTRCGSPLRAGAPPAARDAALVAALRRAGAVVVGKTVTAEFAFTHPPRTRSPLDPARSPGGSSTGSAVAVAAGMVPMSVGTQTAGSLVRPAAFCGVAALKASSGALPRAGVLATSPTLDTPGVIAAGAGDLLVAARALLPGDPGLPGPPRLGWWATGAWERIEPAARRALEGVLAAAAHAGAPPVAVRGPDDRPLAAAQRTLQLAELHSTLGPELRGSEDRLSPELRDALAEGAAIGEEAIERARAAAREGASAWSRALGSVDALLTPATLGTPPRDLTTTGDPELCRVWTLLGVPAVALPLAWTPAGLPAGLQAVARRGADLRLLAAAAWLEEHVAGPG